MDGVGSAGLGDLWKMSSVAVVGVSIMGNTELGCLFRSRFVGWLPLSLDKHINTGMASSELSKHRATWQQESQEMPPAPLLG